MIGMQFTEREVSSYACRVKQQWAHSLGSTSIHRYVDAQGPDRILLVSLPATGSRGRSKSLHGCARNASARAQKYQENYNMMEVSTKESIRRH